MVKAQQNSKRSSTIYILIFSTPVTNNNKKIVNMSIFGAFFDTKKQNILCGRVNSKF
jgi:hypothetical protein